MQKLQQLYSRYFLGPGSELNWYVLITVLYFVTHLLSLTLLPVFADEAIYIRWAQLIIDEPTRYAFFPLNDGKTPLFIWLLVPFQFLVSNQLLAARLVSVLIGFLQVLLTGSLLRQLKTSQVVQQFGMLCVVFLPYWFFHHRMALMDGLLTLCITASVFCGIKVIQLLDEKKAAITSLSEVFIQIPALLNKPTLVWTFLGGLAFGAALWSKLPAVLAAPGVLLLVFINHRKTFLARLYQLLPLGSMLAIGIVVFGLLKLHPAFGQLFSRGGDFLFPLQEVLGGKWIITIQQIPNYLFYFSMYLSPGMLILLVFGNLLPNIQRRKIVVLTLAGLAFLAPIALLGKVVYARYLLPAAPFFTIAACLGLDALLQAMIKPGSKQVVSIKIVVGIAAILIAITSSTFIIPSITNVNKIPFVESDTTQYLTEWSAGQGIYESTNLIMQEAQDKRVAIATEGYFGTLPDGMLLYLHRRDVKNIMLEGIGQPVVGIPASFAQKAASYDTVYLVVNSHRNKLDLTPDKLVAEYCRPYEAPCLQVWDITQDLPAITK